MTNIIFISDLHLSWNQPIGRLDNMIETQFKKLEFVLRFAKENNAIILQAGDFMDKPRSWFLLPRLIDLLKKYEIPIYCVYGQHDTYMYSDETKDNTSLGILAKAGLVTILDEQPTILSNKIIAWGSSYGQNIPVPPPEAENLTKILVLHAPIATEWVGGTFIDAKGFLEMHTSYDLILCGDIHREFLIKDRDRIIMNTGPLTRRQATEYNMTHEPCFFFLEHLGKIKRIKIPHEPAKDVLTREHIEKEENKNQMLADFIEKIGTEDKTDSASFDDVLQGLVKSSNVGKEVTDIISKVMSQ